VGCLNEGLVIVSSYVISLSAFLYYKAIGKFPRYTVVHDLHKAFNLLYVHDYIAKSCMQQADIIQNHENEHVCSTGQYEATHENYKRLELGSGQAYDHSSD
jgi:hypothetical protein